ncbi:hypothetical protein [Persephonella sp.]
MQVLLINPEKKSKKSKKTKRGAAMAKKKKKTTRKTTAKKTTRKRRTTMKRRRISTRRNPSMNPLVAYTIGGFTGLVTSKMIDSIKPITLPLGITAGNLTSAAVGYLMYTKGRGTVRQIGTGHLASALGLIAVNLVDGLTGGKVLKGGLHGLEENYLNGLEEGYMLEEMIEEPQVLEGLEEYQEEPELQIIG